MYLDDYGATHLSFTYFTESPRATVRYAILTHSNELIDFPNPTNQISEKYKVATTSRDGKHETEKIELFSDKPTHIKL